MQFSRIGGGICASDLFVSIHSRLREVIGLHITYGLMKCHRESWNRNYQNNSNNNQIEEKNKKKTEN